MQLTEEYHDEISLFRHMVFLLNPMDHTDWLMLICSSAIEYPQWPNHEDGAFKYDNSQLKCLCCFFGMYRDQKAFNDHHYQFALLATLLALSNLE